MTRSYLIIVIALVAYGTLLAAIVYALVYYLKAVGSKVDAIVLVLIIVAIIILLALLVFSIISNCVKVFWISIIGIIASFVAFLIFIILVIIYLASEKVYYNAAGVIWKNKKFTAVSIKIENAEGCCGFEEIDGRCSNNSIITCKSLFKSQIIDKKLLISLLLFLYAFAAHIHIILSIVGILELKSFNKRVKNSDPTSSDDRSISRSEDDDENRRGDNPELFNLRVMKKKHEKDSEKLHKNNEQRQSDDSMEPSSSEREQNVFI